MTNNEFINKSVGLPWVDRACSWQAMDCWGVVIMYYEHVLNKVLPVIQGYKTGDVTLASEYPIQLTNWIKLDKPAANAVFLSYKNGEPVHVGIVLDDADIIHSMGGTSGQVRIDNITILNRLFEKVEFYQYADLLP